MSLISDEYDNAGEFGTSPTAAAINSYVMAPLKHLFGIHPKPTKRSLSEEAECGSPESLSEWLRRGSDVNEVDPYGYTPLVNASLRFVQQFQTFFVKLILKLPVLQRLQKVSPVFD